MVGPLQPETLSQRVAALARTHPDGLAFATSEHRASWADYDRRADAVAAALISTGLGAGERVGVFAEDGAGVHVAFLGAQRAGLVVVGIGARAGDRELSHLLARTGARALITGPSHRGRPQAELLASLADAGVAIDNQLTVTPDGRLLDHRSGPANPSEAPAGRDLPGTLRDIAVDDLWLLNSTSGTTGLPKCVMHTQARWQYFHQLAVEAADLAAGDVFCSAIPAPFGFGLWTAHVTPTLLGAPCVLTPRFRAEETIELIEQFAVTVLCAVSTQFVMLLNSPALCEGRLASLRALFTGGEAVPPERAAEFEDRTGAAVLQFYGSNETGALSRTTLADTRERRLTTAGRVIEGMHVRLFDEAGSDVTRSGGPGQPGCRGPATSLGYWDDAEANRRLLTADGWMLTGDLATLDDEGVLRVVGRTSDIIIRGGKNISAAAVEAEVGTHPAVALCAAVGMPDPVFGERVCIYVVLHPGASLSLDGVVDHLSGRGVSKEWCPEHLVVVPDLPRSSGGKIAKGELRAAIGAGRLPPPPPPPG